MVEALVGNCPTLWGEGDSVANTRYDVPPDLFLKLNIRLGDRVEALAIKYATVAPLQPVIQNATGYIVRAPRAVQSWLIFDGLLTTLADFNKLTMLQRSPAPPASYPPLAPLAVSGIITVLPLLAVGDGTWTSNNAHAVYQGYTNQVTFGFIENTDADRDWGYPTYLNLCGDHLAFTAPF